MFAYSDQIATNSVYTSALSHCNHSHGLTRCVSATCLASVYQALCFLFHVSASLCSTLSWPFCLIPVHVSEALSTCHQFHVGFLYAVLYAFLPLSLCRRSVLNPLFALSGYFELNKYVRA